MCWFKDVGDQFMTDSPVRYFAVAAALFFLLPACASGGGDGSGDDGTSTEGATGEATEGTTDEGTTTGETTEGGDDGATTVYVPPERGEGCQFDLENKGKTVGKHIKDFGLKQVFGPTKEETDAYWLHSNCGEKKAVWIILATGW